MIKDLVVNLPVGAGRDAAAPYAISIAEAFGAHVAGVAFSYEPVIPPTIMGTVPASFIESQRAESDKAANDAVARFNDAARRAGVSAESRALSASLAGAADRLAEIARRLGLPVIGHAQPDRS